jgi:hypothetical protein
MGDKIRDSRVKRTAEETGEDREEESEEQTRKDKDSRRHGRGDSPQERSKRGHR